MHKLRFTTAQTNSHSDSVRFRVVHPQASLTPGVLRTQAHAHHAPSSAFIILALRPTQTRTHSHQVHSR
eukprot:5479325-Pyramimonas_sp.AAC.1